MITESTTRSQVGATISIQWIFQQNKAYFSFYKSKILHYSTLQLHVWEIQNQNENFKSFLLAKLMTKETQHNQGLAELHHLGHEFLSFFIVLDKLVMDYGHVSFHGELLAHQSIHTETLQSIMDAMRE